MTIGEFKSAIKGRRLYVWVKWQLDDGDYVEVPQIKFLRAINADTPNDGAHGGIDDGSHIEAVIRDDGDVYVN